MNHSILSEPRSAGILLHPTSLPGKSIGSFGPEAHRFLEFMIAAGQRLWQVCPLGPTGYGDSPYQCFSAFAGNPLLIGLEPLVALGYLDADALADAPDTGNRVDYGAVIPWKNAVLKQSYARFEQHATNSDRAKLERFVELNASWLEDYALFVAIKEAHEGRPWTEWAPPLRDRHPDAIATFSAEHRERINLSYYLQWVFQTQWYELRAVASAHGIKIIGDLPIFVAHDSADVWAHRELFYLDDVGNPTVVAGVPPDYFSATGQLWGNPIYNWDRHQDDGFAWWIDVLAGKFSLYDYVRIDHFRGFSAYWSIPAGDENALNGHWVGSPGEQLFAAAEERLGKLPVIAEDLGVITDDVVELIERFGFARMKVLQFAFNASERNLYLPYKYERNAIAYTGTHDNDTIVGWLESASEADRAFALRYLRAGSEPHWDFIRGAFASPAHFAVVPMQDPLGLGSSARMNTPGTLGGNWEFKLTQEQLNPETARRLYELSELYGRV
ncbi:MAG: 4-alpha-glucanotransferase [Spirochaetales bacterium]